MSFPHRVTGLSLRDRVRSSGLCEELQVVLLLLGVERIQLRGFGHFSVSTDTTHKDGTSLVFK